MSPLPKICYYINGFVVKIDMNKDTFISKVIKFDGTDVGKVMWHDSGNNILVNLFPKVIHIIG